MISVILTLLKNLVWTSSMLSLDLLEKALTLVLLLGLVVARLTASQFSAESRCKSEYITDLISNVF